MTSRVVVLADDLTGAADTAGQFDRAGWTAELQVGPGGPSEAEVVAITTDSRALEPAAAADAVRTALDKVTFDEGSAAVYLKIDSTLRGPVRAMTDAVVAARAGDVVAVVCPAFPAVGRTLVDGILLVHGVPVAQTAVGRDPVTPVRESHVPTLLDAPLVVLDPRADDTELAAALRGRGPVVVVDARDEADLDRVARAVIALGNQAVAVGSAGLAAHLARRWRPLPRGPVLVVVSSLHDASRGQAELLAAAGARRIQPDAATLCDAGAWEEFARSIVSDAAVDDFGVLVLMGPAAEGATVAPSVVADRLGELASRLVSTVRPAGLVLAGGDGALAVLTALSATGIRLSGEVADGVPLGYLTGGPDAGLPVATKAGGFGTDDILIRAAEAVRSSPLDPRRSRA
ncbi:four-carbon acid sugar kinase family protein [Kribbella qitaiheensis]|uniref:four-carbon acid sugar kinase family protein n=1 Tax=Kribbella qitaiheensis TaxID=1544730 RepID=UPI00360B6119